MNRQNPRTTRSTPHSKDRCNFQFADGRRCRMLRHQTSGELCLFHHRTLLQLESAEKIGAELLALGDNFQHPIRINFVLGKLFAHVVTGRMHRRDASTLAYIAQLLLQTIDEKRYERARDQYDYRGWTDAVDLKYGRPTRPKPTAHTRPAAPRPAPTNAQIPDPIRAQYPPPANPEVPNPSFDAPRFRQTFRQLVTDPCRPAANANHHAQQPPNPPARL